MIKKRDCFVLIFSLVENCELGELCHLMSISVISVEEGAGAVSKVK